MIHKTPAVKMHIACLSKEDDRAVQWLSVLINVADQLFYPCEHIAWAADADLIRAESKKWWLFSTALWGTSLLLGILRSEVIYAQKSFKCARMAQLPEILYHAIKFPCGFSFPRVILMPNALCRSQP